MYQYHKKETINSTNKPIVTDLSWGKTSVLYKGTNTEYKDAILWANGHCEWNWNTHGTRHDPGIQPGDVKDLVKKYKCEYVILSRGMKNILQTDPKTLKWLKENNIDYVILNTIDAVKLYNESNLKNIGLLLHSTC